MSINIKVVATTEGMPQLRNVPQRSAAAVVIEGLPRARGHIDYATRIRPWEIGPLPVSSLLGTRPGCDNFRLERLEVLRYVHLLRDGLSEGFSSRFSSNFLNEIALNMCENQVSNNLLEKKYTDSI